MKLSFSLLMQIFPLALTGLLPAINYINDRTSIRKVAKENMWWDVSIKKVSKLSEERTYLVSFQDWNGQWFSKSCKFTKSGMEWRNEN